MSFGSRLKEERKLKKMTQEELAKATSLHKTSLLSYEKETVSPPASFLEKLVKLDFDVNYIISGFRNSTNSNAADIVSNHAFTRDKESDIEETNVYIPLVDAMLCAGHGSLETQDNIIESIPFPRSFIEQKGNPKNMVLFRVSGDSMSPTIHDKDMVLIDESKKNLEIGKIYAVGFEDVIYLKQVDFLPKTLVLKSHNKDYKDIELKMSEYNEEHFRVIGKLLWVSREF